MTNRTSNGSREIFKHTSGLGFNAEKESGTGPGVGDI
jgi:hypothetical protein